MNALDLEFVRAQFPALTEPSLEGWRFFENAGGSYACRQVIERLNRFYVETKVQPYGEFPASIRAGQAMDEGRARLAAYLDVAEDEVLVGPSTTQNVYVLAKAFRAGWRAGDEVVVTNQDHEANVGAWRRLAETGITIKEWSADPQTGELLVDDLRPLLTERTRVVACTHCSNIVASPNPIPRISQLVHECGASLVVDGVSYAPHGLPHVAALGADVYLFSLYKVYGPHQGVMVVRRETMERLGNQGHDFNDGVVSKRLIPAGPDHAQVAAANGVVDYFDLLHDHHYPDAAAPAVRRQRIHDLMRGAERERLGPLLAFLVGRDDVRVLGPVDATHRVPTVALDTRKRPEALAKALAAEGIMAGWSDFYAPRILERMGVDPSRGVLRLSFVHYTSDDDVGALIEALRRCL